ncbi:DUF1998 domain-containing protein [Nakamurella flava]|uniref:DUF1998 domain-containing protein n=1 Tax=Nakamurella flava TaxID=2576308 RepID=A0A4U6QEN6_9ACTN|nr:DEAD/DEAH box helicase [Nakamurella flava]TKV58456.1 DUF1998 domain-containing protein [Nakamurella flava]
MTSVTSGVLHTEFLAARAGEPVSWPEWVPAELRAACARRGVIAPWSHQAATADLAASGRDVVVSTGTASGKSLGYQLPVLAAAMADPRTCSLYLSPTKALAADQLASLVGFELPGVRPARYDGDTTTDERDWARAHGNVLLTNPDMLHRGILPQHGRWSRVLRRLRYVVLDECHAYRGVFGAHVALTLRRLVRLARRYGSDPVFVLASATAADPAGAGRRLTGRPCVAVTADGAPRPASTFVLCEPPALDGVAGENGAPIRRSAGTHAAHVMADLVAAGTRTLTFVRSRHGAETTAVTAGRLLDEAVGSAAGRVAAYRGGYLAEDRRALERALASGELLGLASTNALELGIDIAGLDAVVLTGWPGTLASLWQQAGRAGRRAAPEPGRPDPMAVFVARDDPLDTYLVHHPERIFGRPVEAAVFDPANPYVLGPHLACAAAERHLTEDDLELFATPGLSGAEQAAAVQAVRAVVTDLVARRILRRRPAGWFWAEPGSPAERVDLRGGGGGQVAIVEGESGRLLGHVDVGRAPSQVHPGAVHLHQGESYVVDDMDLVDGVAFVHRASPPWTTVARSISSVDLTDPSAARTLTGGIRVGYGPARATGQVVGYLRKRSDGELIDAVPLDMPAHALDTRAVWYSIPEDVLLAAGLDEGEIPGALHAAEHAAIGLLPLFAGCDRWDIGGLSTARHPDTGDPTVIVYDGYPGGAGFAERGMAVLADWLAAVRDLVRDCPCERGCPSCVQSPKCGNGNNPLSKTGAPVVLDLVLQSLALETDLRSTGATVRA